MLYFPGCGHRAPSHFSFPSKNVQLDYNIMVFVGCPVSLINNYSTSNKFLFKDDSQKHFYYTPENEHGTPNFW